MSGAGTLGGVSVLLVRRRGGRGTAAPPGAAAEAGAVEAGAAAGTGGAAGASVADGAAGAAGAGVAAEVAGAGPAAAVCGPAPAELRVLPTAATICSYFSRPARAPSTYPAARPAANFTIAIRIPLIPRPRPSSVFSLVGVPERGELKPVTPRAWQETGHPT